MQRASAPAATSAGAVINALLGAPEGLTRSELRSATGLSQATLVGLLKNPTNGNGRAGNGRSGKAPEPGRLAPLLESSEQARPQRGRRSGAPAARHRLRADKAHILGIDLGRKHVAVGAGDALGRALRRGEGTWMERVELDVDHEPWKALDTARDFAAKVVADLERDAGIRRDDFAGIGVSVTSAIEPTGLFRPGWMADDWHGVRPIKELTERLRARGLTFPLVIDKDAHHTALAEQRWGPGRNVADFVSVKWAHGVSAGIVMGGQLQRGVGGSAGAFGHTPIVKIDREPDEFGFPHDWWEPEEHLPCSRCGKIECLEAIIGTDRLIHEVARDDITPDDIRHEKRSRKRNLHKERGIDPTIQSIKELALEDRDNSLEAIILKMAAKRLGNALGAVVNLLNPEIVVIGGSFERADYDLLGAPVQQGLRHVAIAPTYRDVDVRFTEQNVLAGTFASVIEHGEVASFLEKRAMEEQAAASEAREDDAVART